MAVELFAVLAAGVLAAAIGVMNQSAAEGPLPCCAMFMAASGRVVSERGYQTPTPPPADWEAAQDGADVKPAFRRFHAGQIGDPNCIGGHGSVLLGQQIGRDGPAVCGFPCVWGPEPSPQAAIRLAAFIKRAIRLPLCRWPRLLSRKREAWPAISPPALCKCSAYSQKHGDWGIFLFSAAGSAPSPGVVARPADRQCLAQDLDAGVRQPAV